MADLLSIDTSQVHHLAADMQANADQVEGRAELVVARTSFAIVATAQVLAPKDTTNLAQSIDADVDGLSAVIGPTAEYGGYVEEGTDGPYLIENAFGWGITVEHPGISPQPYLGPAFDQHEPAFVKAIAAIGRRILA